jgi:type I restriction enzyme S subunit
MGAKMSEDGRGYKQTEVGVIPEDWEIVSTSRVCDMIVDCKNRTPPIFEMGDYAVVRTPNVRSGKFVREDLYFTDENSFKEWTARAVPQPGDVLITREAPLGEVCLAPSDLPVCLGQRMMLYRPNTAEVDYRFLLFALMSTGVQACLLKKIGGSTVGHAKVDDIRNLQIPLPPSRIEQEAIAEALSDADALIESLEQLLTKKRQIKQGAMQELLTGKKRLPGFAEKWQEKPFDAVLVRRNAKACQIQASEYQPIGRWPVIDQGKDPVVGFCDVYARCYHCPNGGVIVFGDHTCIVKFIDFDFVVGADGTQILEAVAGESTRFHAFQLQHRGIESTGYNRHFRFLKERLFLAPPFPEQTAIASVLSDMDSELSSLETKLTKARQLKQGMMQNLLTGKIRLV